MEIARLRKFQLAVEALRFTAPRLFGEIKDVLGADAIDDPISDTAHSIKEALNSGEILEIEGAATLIPFVEWRSEHLCEFARHESLDVRRAAYLMLSRLKLIGAKWAISLVETGLKDGDCIIRERAIVIFNELGADLGVTFAANLKACLEVDHFKSKFSKFDVLQDLGLEVCLVRLLVSGFDHVTEFTQHQDLKVRRVAYGPLL